MDVLHHRFFLAGGGTSYAVTGLIVRGSSSTCSQTTRMCFPVVAHPKVEGRPLESLGTVRFFGLLTTSQTSSCEIPCSLSIVGCRSHAHEEQGTIAPVGLSLRDLVLDRV